MQGEPSEPLTMYPGQVATLHADYELTEGASRNVNPSWTASGGVSLSATTGLEIQVTANSAGLATVTCTLDGVSGSFYINVLPLARAVPKHLRVLFYGFQ